MDEMCEFCPEIGSGETCTVCGHVDEVDTELFDEQPLDDTA
jgi:hypothetical protein